MSPKSKIGLRRLQSRQAAKSLLQDLTAGRTDPYEAYRRLYIVWCRNNAAIQELRPLFRMTGIEPGAMSVTEEFRGQVVSMAKEILLQFSD
jgi:hypothetical protein